jgi:very-short-patch-repair endonuclease
MTLTQLVTSLDGVARIGQLLSAGATATQIKAAVRMGRLTRIRKGWVHSPNADPAIIRAVALGGRLGCVSATRYRGLWTPELPDVPHVSRPAHSGHHHGEIADEIVHWQSSSWARGGAVESVERAIRQILLCCTYEDALTIIDSALNTRMLSSAGIARAVDSLPPRFRDVLIDIDPNSESGIETLCRYRLSRFLPVRSQVQIDGIGRVDLLIGDRLIIEADGRRWHEGSFFADRSRDLALQRRGYIVIRVGYSNVMHEWPIVELAIRGLVERREHLWSAPHRRAGLA